MIFTIILIAATCWCMYRVLVLTLDAPLTATGNHAVRWTKKAKRYVSVLAYSLTGVLASFIAFFS